MPEEIESSPSAVMSGSGREVARLLSESADQRIVAVTFPDNDQGRAAEQVIQRVMAFLPQLIQERQQQTLTKLIDAFLSGITPHSRPPQRPVRASRPRPRR
jgi:hypothetical protein